MVGPVYPSEAWQQQYMADLASRIWGWKRAYYLGSSDVDDHTFDLHWRNLLWLEAKYPHLVTYDTPTAAVGYQQDP